ncbi:IS3 family transposase [Gilliamella sp.]
MDWFNYNRLHSTLNYQSPIEYKKKSMTLSFWY